MVYYIDENDERFSLLMTYWTNAIFLQDYQEEGIEIDQDYIDEFLVWINENYEKLKLYGVFQL
jgi:hypothetical protein